MSTPYERGSNFGFLIYDIGRLFTKRFQLESEHLGISIAEAKVLSALSRNPNVSQAQLAELSGVEPMTIVRILDRMEADGWIERRPHPTDRRARQLHLAEKSQSMIAQILKLSAQLRAEALAGIKSEERSMLMDLLERVHEQLLQGLSEQNSKATRDSNGSGSEARTTRKRPQARISSSRIKTQRTSR